MAKVTIKGKKVTGTKKKDKIVWQNKKAWKKALTVNAGSGNDTIDFSKSAYKNTLNGQAGNDVIKGGKKDDKINGGAGNDKLYGNAGNDKLYGDSGKDIITGGKGKDYIEGGTDDDKLYGNVGNDTIKGGKGDDYIDGGDNDDKLYGEYGANTIKGGAGIDTIYGGTGDDKIAGGADNDSINAGKGINTLYFGKNEGTDTVYNGGGKDIIYFNKAASLANVKAKYKGNNLVLSATGTSVVIKDYKLGGHSAQYIQVGNTKQKLSTFLKTAIPVPPPQPPVVIDPYQAGNVIKGTDGNDSLVLTFGENKEGIFDNQKEILKSDYGATDAWINKYNIDLVQQAYKVSNTYNSVKVIIQNIKNYEHCVADYDNPNYTGDTYFRHWPKEYWENKLANANADAYGTTYTWNQYKESVLAEYEEGTDEYQQAEHDLNYSLVFAKYKNDADNLAKYQSYANGEAVPTFRDIAGEEGVQYWIDKRDAVARNIDGFTGSKEVWETLRDSGTASDEEIAAAYNTYQADLERYNLYKEYAENYYNEDYLGEGYVSPNGTNYVSFRQEAIAEAKTIHDYYGKEYRPQTGTEYWWQKAEEAGRLVNGYQGSLSLMNEFYLRSKEGDPRNIYYDRYKEYKDEFWASYDEWIQYDEYVDNWEDTDYIGYFSADHSDDVLLTQDDWERRLASTQSSLNGQIYNYNNEADRLNTLVQYIKDNAPTKNDRDTALQILTHLSTSGAGGIIIAGDGDDDITIGRLDPKVTNPSFGNVFAMGQEGDDTYNIEFYNNLYPISIEIYDHDGDNTVRLKPNDLKSGNIGVYANVTLVKGDNGEYEKDEDGNYIYTIENFRTSINDSGNINSMIERSPLKDGDCGYAMLMVDTKTYSNLHAFDYGGADKNGIKFDADTIEHLDKIFAADGKYITKAQLETMFQKTANLLANMGYSSFMDAMCLDGVYDDYETRQHNLYTLTSSEGLGSLEWITKTGDEPSESDIIEGATEGTVGTNTNDYLISSEGNETISAGLGNDTITFEGDFGYDILQSSSTKDNQGNARQTDVLNLTEYSVKDGTLKFSANGNDLVLTAYDEETVKGTVTYKDFLLGGDDGFSSRKFVLNASDHTYSVWFNNVPEVAQDDVIALDINDNSNNNYNIRFFKGVDGNTVRIYANANRGYYYLLGDTPLDLTTVDGEVTEINSLGEANDKYREKLSETTNLIIKDSGGVDVLDMVDLLNTNQQKDYDMRFFFDMDDEGNVVSDTKHIIWTDHFKPLVPKSNYNGEVQYDETRAYATDELIKLLNNDPEHMKGSITIQGDIEKIMNNDHIDYSQFSWVDSNEDESIKISKLIESLKIDVAPWLKENGYTSVKNALTTLKAAIDTKQEEIDAIDYSGVERDNNGNIIPETLPAEYKTILSAQKDLQDKIDELLGFYNKGYETILNTNIIGTDGDDNITGSTPTKYIEGRQGNDIIDLTTGTPENVKIYYDLTRHDENGNWCGDGHDVVINAVRNVLVEQEQGKGADADKIYINIGDMEVTPKFQVDGWDLIMGMYDNSSELKGSIRFKDYFKMHYAEYSPARVDDIVVIDTEGEHLMSLYEMTRQEGAVINSDANVIIGTSGKDIFEGTNPDLEHNKSGDDIVYTNGATSWTESYADNITSTGGDDTYYITPVENNGNARFTYTVGNGNDTIYGANYLTFLTLNYNNQNVSMEFRKSDDNDIRMVFFDYEGNNLGSLTIKESDIHWNNDGTISTAYTGGGFLSHNNTDTFFIKKDDGDEGTGYKLNKLVKQYTDMGASLVENNDTPYIRIFKITNETDNGIEISKMAGKVDRIVFADGIAVTNSALSGDDLVLTYTGGKTIVVKGYKTGNSSVYDVNINGEYTTLGDLSGLYYGTTGDDVFTHSTEENVIKTYNLNTGNDTVEFAVSHNNGTNYENGQIVYNKAIINSQGGSNSTDTIKLEDYSLYYINQPSTYKSSLRFGFVGDGKGITIKGEKELYYTTNNTAYKQTDITYNNYLTGESSELVVQMKNGDYNKSYYKVHRYNTAQTINLDSSDSVFPYEDNTSHVLYIKASSGTSKITSSSDHYSQILTDGGAALKYTGHADDIIVTNSTSSNDTYNINNTSSAKLLITDKGGTNDKLYLQGLNVYAGNNEIENLFLSFNVNADADKTTNDKFYITYSANYQGAQPLWNMAQYALAGNSDLYYSTVTIDAAKQNGKNVGIEHVIVQYQNDGQIKNAELNMENWYGAIKQQVDSWLTTNADWMVENNLTSTADVFKMMSTSAYNNQNNQGRIDGLREIYESHNASQYIIS